MKQAYDAGAEVGEVARLRDGAHGAYVADSTFLDSLSTTAFREGDNGSHVGHGDCDDGELEESVELHSGYITRSIYPQAMVAPTKAHSSRRKFLAYWVATVPYYNLKRGTDRTGAAVMGRYTWFEGELSNY